MRMVVDHRENADLLIKRLRQNGHEVVTEELKIGDYQVENSLLVERKTFPDFANSVRNGRLFKQVACLVYQKTSACLILEGTPLPACLALLFCDMEHDP